MKRHFEHLQQRQKRVGKYGSDIVNCDSSIPPSPNSGSKISLKNPHASNEQHSYAMFSGQKLEPKIGKNSGNSSISASELRYRGSTTNSFGSNNNNSVDSNAEYVENKHISVQKMRQNASQRLQQAESIEQTVAKVNLCVHYILIFLFLIFDNAIDGRLVFKNGNINC